MGPRKPKVVPDAANIGTRNITSGPDDYARVIRLLVIVRDELELAGRPPGDLVTITRQANDALINDLAIVSRLIRKMAER